MWPGSSRANRPRPQIPSGVLSDVRNTKQTQLGDLNTVLDAEET